jgi:serine/threonine protein kinase
MVKTLDANIRNI